MCVADPEIAEWLDGNVGLAHAYSGTCAIDIDDLAICTAYLAERSIDLAALLDAPDAVRIESRPGRAKLLYRVDKPLPSFKLGSLELRCAAANGLTVQDVLPPSIHPETGKPYTWRYGTGGGHWSKLPPLPGQLANLWQGLIAPAAPKAPAPARGSVHAPRLRALLDTQNPNVDYPEWIAVGMALHYETSGSAAGLALWNEWSARGAKYVGLGDLEQHWRSFRVEHENPRTLASLRSQSAATADEFEDVPAGAAPARVAPAGLQAPLRALPGSEVGGTRDRALETLRSVRRTKMGTIESRISNVIAVLGVPEVSGWELALDEFQDVIMIAQQGGREWRALIDTDYTNLRAWLETSGNCDPIPHEMIRQGALLVAERNRMDTARIWLEGLKWDGVPRVEHFCSTYFGTNDTPYEQAVSAYLWTALAGRVVAPGCQADMVPVLIGRQGVGKSRGVQAMVPSPEHYVEIRMDEPDDAIARKCRGVLIGEMAELRGLRATDVERVKAFITRTHEKWVPKYKEFATNYPRRFLIVGTTNDEEFLPPDSEHRRWLPLHTMKVDVDAIRRDRDQLWAEALALYSVEGIVWHTVEPLAVEARDAAAGEDGWAEDVAKWLDETKGRPVRMQDVLTGAIGLDPRTIQRVHEMRVGRILRELGYSRHTARIAGRLQKVWTPGA